MAKTLSKESPQTKTDDKPDGKTIAIVPQSESKLIRISSKRQITLPVEFYEVLDFGSEAECFVYNGGLFIQPANEDDEDYSTEILRDLVAAGYSGDELVTEFDRHRKMVRPAAEAMRADASENAEALSYDDFGC